MYCVFKMYKIETNQQTNYVYIKYHAAGAELCEQVKGEYWCRCASSTVHRGNDTEYYIGQTIQYIGGECEEIPISL